MGLEATIYDVKGATKEKERLHPAGEVVHSSLLIQPGRL